MPPSFTQRVLAATAALLGACQGPAPAPSPEEARALPAAVAQGTELLRQLRARRPSAGVDGVVAELVDGARSEPPSPRTAEALTLAVDLLLARRALQGGAEDLARADEVLQLAARDPDLARACVALRRRAEETAPGDPLARGALATRCPWLVPAPAPAPRAEPSRPLGAFRRVVVDPGHGGSDPGAVGPTGLHEAAVNLDVARRVAERLATQHGVQVVLSRDRNVYVSLEDRIAQANDARADLFLSIHCNATTNPASHGLSVWVLDTTSDRVAARVTAREGEFLTEDALGSDLPRILADLRLSQHGQRSYALAGVVQRALLHDVRLFHPDAEDQGVRPARFHVLVSARMPAVLVELSFISNPTEEQRLRTDRYRDLLASAVARAVGTFR
ncbi:MAG: N-acetylmuramoyl-L-alanine amidase [Deltaproteobacteria bacterium]|nr:N-acetylmuramoyl-L-alanine amidase [Deltaproteobacteria bacterium]